MLDFGTSFEVHEGDTVNDLLNRIKHGHFVKRVRIVIRNVPLKERSNLKLHGNSKVDIVQPITQEPAFLHTEVHLSIVN